MMLKVRCPINFCPFYCISQHYLWLNFISFHEPPGDDPFSVSYYLGTRTIGVISKIDQAASDSKALAAVQALLSNQGPPKTADILWIALIGQSVSIASAQSGNVESSLETAWRAESESLKSILTGAPQSKLGRVALIDALAGQIRNRMKLRLPNLLSGYIYISLFLVSML